MHVSILDRVSSISKFGQLSQNKQESFFAFVCHAYSSHVYRAIFLMKTDERWKNTAINNRF